MTPYPFVLLRIFSTPADADEVWALAEALRHPEPEER